VNFQVNLRCSYIKEHNSKINKRLKRTAEESAALMAVNCPFYRPKTVSEEL